MAEIKICIWNVQNYGSATDGESTSALRWGVNDELRNPFVKAVLEKHGVDVMMMMEVWQSNGNGSLANLVRRLSHGYPTNWAYSYCGSGLANANPNPPQAKGEVTFQTDARSEGYGVAWRLDPGKFQLLQGLHPIAEETNAHGGARPAGNGPLNLVTMGRPEEKKAISAHETEFTIPGGYMPPSPNPCDGHRQPVAAWEPLEFPTTGAANPRMLRMEQVRRPAYVVLKVSGEPNPLAALCPIAAYHAPSRKERAAWGPFQAGLSRELYVTNQAAGLAPEAALQWCEKTVFGGDFNYAEANWPGEYQYFTAPFDQGPRGGADCGAVPNGDQAETLRPTTVQLLKEDHKTPITGPNMSEYLALEIDHVFWRPRRGNQAQRVNLMEMFMKEPQVFRDALEPLRKTLRLLEAAMRGPDRQVGARGPEWRENARAEWKPYITAGSASFYDYAAFTRQVDAVVARTANTMAARQAAECAHLFVSDHFPLVLSLNW